MIQDIKDLIKGLSFKEIVGYSINSENVASTYYWALAKVFEPNDLVKARFEALSNEEKLHMKALLDLHKSIFGDEDYVVPEGLPPFESIAEVKTMDSLIEALETAMQNEDNAHKMYLYIAKEHKEHKKLFKYLAMTEKSHYETLKQELEFFQEDFGEDPGAGSRSLGEVYARPFFRPPDIGG